MHLNSISTGSADSAWGVCFPPSSTHSFAHLGRDAQKSLETAEPSPGFPVSTSVSYSRWPESTACLIVLCEIVMASAPEWKLWLVDESCVTYEKANGAFPRETEWLPPGGILRAAVLSCSWVTVFTLSFFRSVLLSSTFGSHVFHFLFCSRGPCPGPGAEAANSVWLVVCSSSRVNEMCLINLLQSTASS